MTYISSPVINDWTRQILIGTILGGASIVKPGGNCYLAMHSKHKLWLKYKAAELDMFSTQNSFVNELKWRSGCFPIFTDLRNLFYINDKKTVNMNILDKLRDIGLAIWFGDAGKVENGCVHLKTGRFSEEDNKLICSYFNEVGIKCEVEKRRNFKIVLEGQKFLKIIGNRLPDFMFDKLDSKLN